MSHVRTPLLIAALSITACDSVEGVDLSGVEGIELADEDTRETAVDLVAYGYSAERLAIRIVPDLTSTENSIASRPTVVLDGDGVISTDTILPSADDSRFRQWWSGVSFTHVNKNICLVVITDSDNATYTAAPSAVYEVTSWVVSNYNTVGQMNGLTFSRKTGYVSSTGIATPNNTSGCDHYTFIFGYESYFSAHPSEVGVAQYPTGNSKPGQWLAVKASYGNATTTAEKNRLEHVLTHEVGHTISMEHSDSGGLCGLFSDPDSPRHIHIPNTPENTTSSVMRRCMPLWPDGELTDSDKTALRALF